MEWVLLQYDGLKRTGPFPQLRSTNTDDLGGAEGVEAVDQCDANMDFGGLSITVPIPSPSGVHPRRTGLRHLGWGDSTVRMTEVTASIARCPPRRSPLLPRLNDERNLANLPKRFVRSSTNPKRGKDHL